MDVLSSQDRGAPYAAHSDHPDISAAPHFTPANPAHVSSPPPSDPTEHKPPDASSRGGTIKIILAATHPTPDHVNPSHGPTDSTNHTKQTLTSLRPIATIHPTAIPLAKTESQCARNIVTCALGPTPSNSPAGPGPCTCERSKVLPPLRRFLVILLRSHISHFVSAFVELVGREKRAECGKRM